MKPLFRFAAILLAPAILLAAACGDDDDEPSNGDGNGGELTKVTLMLDWTPNTNHSGIFLAKENGYYEEAGLDVDIQQPGSGAGVAQVVGVGTAQFGISVQESVIPARAEGVPIVSIAAIIQHNTSSLVSLAEDDITAPADLAGKTYGGFGGPLETAIIKKLTECDGGDPEAIKFVDVGESDYLIGMEQDRYDFVWIYDAWDGVRYKEIENKDVNTLPFIDYTDCIPDWYTPLFITNETMIADNPETVRKFLDATTRGFKEAMEDPEAAAAAILKNAPETDEALLKASAAYLATRYVDEGRKWGLQDEEIWTEFQDFLVDSGIVTEEIDVSKAYTNEFLPD